MIPITFPFTPRPFLLRVSVNILILIYSKLEGYSPKHPLVCVIVEGLYGFTECAASFLLIEFYIGHAVPQNVAIFIFSIV